MTFESVLTNITRANIISERLLEGPGGGDSLRIRRRIHARDRRGIRIVCFVSGIKLYGVEILLN